MQWYSSRDAVHWFFFALGTDISILSLEGSARPISQGVTIAIAGDAAFPGMFYAWGIGILLTGIALLKQRNLHIVQGAIFTLQGAAFMLMVSASFDVPDGVGFVLWISIMASTVSAGVLTLMANRAA